VQLSLCRVPSANPVAAILWKLNSRWRKPEIAVGGPVLPAAARHART
jgi:hypothetical protein